MLIIIQIWIASSFVIAAVLTADQLRRPLAAWEAAGRERRFWVALTIASGFHGLGPLGAVAYLTAVLPRFRAADPPAPRAAVHRLGSDVALRRKQRSATEALTLVAGILVFASAVIHGAVIADHLEYYWPSGVFFLVVSCAQAAWVVLAYRHPRNRRILLAGAIGNGLLVVVWAISRTAGMPVGPKPWAAEPIGAADVLATVDQLAAVGLLAIALAIAPRARTTLSRIHARLATALAGPLFIYSILAAFGAEHHH